MKLVMKLVKNRRIAILITVVVAVLATLLGVRKSLNHLAEVVEKMFYDGVRYEDHDYTEPGINSHLGNRSVAAFNLATLLLKRPELEPEARVLLNAQNDYPTANSISEKYSANERMQHAFTTLTEKAVKLALSDQEKAALERHVSDFNGAQIAINNSLYNQMAASWLDDVSILARIIRPFVFASPPQAFG